MQLQALQFQDQILLTLDCPRSLFRRPNSKQHRVPLHPFSAFAFSHRCDTSTQRYTYDVEPADINVPVAAFSCRCRHADFTNSNDSSCSLRVVLYKTREANEIGLHCVHTRLAFSEAYKNQIRSLDRQFLATRHTATSKAVHQTPLRAEG